MPVYTQVTLYSIVNLAVELHRTTCSRASLADRIKRALKKKRMLECVESRIPLLGDSLARETIARGIVALAWCHGRVKISKSTGFARAGREARRRLDSAAKQ